MSKKGGASTTEKRIRAGQKRFLEQLRKCGVVGTAATRAGLGRATVYEWRQTNPDFANAWDEHLALSFEDLEATILERAKKGSDTLAIFLAKARWPEKYREKYHLHKDPELRRFALGMTDVIRKFVPKERLRDAIIYFFAVTGQVLSPNDRVSLGLHLSASESDIAQPSE